MEYISPTLEEWRLLFEAGENFKKAACWNWMDNTDIFGVKCPDTGKIYYCSIMGGGGTHFGLAAYRGTPGLNTFLKMLDGEISHSDVVYEQNCLSCSFEDREMLAKEDLQVIKLLEFKFRGRNQWPQFRDYTPGWYPWFINSSQCRTLTHILRQAVEISMRCLKDKNTVYRKGSRLLVRVMHENDNGIPAWIDSYLEPEPFDVKLAVFRLQDEMLVRKLKTTKADVNFKVEADIFYLPEPVKDGERPYYPVVCAVMDCSSGILVAQEMAANIKDEGHVFLSALLEMITESGHKPSDLFVSKPEARALFSGLCEQIGIHLHVAQCSKSMKKFKASLKARFR